MPGVLIEHPTHRGSTLLVRHPGGPQPDGSVRQAKDYHLRLDENGRVIVSETVWRRIQEAQVLHGGADFVSVSQVGNPPAQGMATPGDTLLLARTFRQQGDGRITDDTDAYKAEVVARALAPRGVKPRVEVNRNT